MDGGVGPPGVDFPALGRLFQKGCPAFLGQGAARQVLVVKWAVEKPQWESF